MNRRDLLRLLTVALPALAGLPADQLAALEQSVSARRRGRPGLFDPHQFDTVDQLSEIIIPATSSPGAHAAGVATFIEHIVADWYSPDERAAFLAGLADVDARSRKTSGQAFVAIPAVEQLAVVQELEASMQPESFWSRFKALTLYGYFSSQPGIEDALKVPFMPGYYDGDVPVGGAAKGSR